MPSVITIRLGLPIGPVLAPFVNAYLVRSGDGWVVVDTGPPGCASRILRALHRYHIPLETVRLILLTHGHYDHAGSAWELQRLLPTRPPIAMHPGDRDFVSGKRLPTSLRPTSLAGAFGFAVGALVTLTSPRWAWPETVLDEVLWLDGVGHSNQASDLHPLCGMEAGAISTPGHSAGSVSLLLPTGEAIVGDIISRGLHQADPCRPALVDHRDAVTPSLRRIAGLRPSVVYAGHGGPFLGVDLQRLVEHL